jgi:hypothetical protein
MGALTNRVGLSASLESNYLRSLAPFITNVSMASSLVAAIVILSFERSKANAKSILLGVLTLSVFAVEISLSVYLFLVRPVRAPTSLSVVYVLIGLVPFGLGCTMFTLASIVTAQ